MGETMVPKPRLLALCYDEGKDGSAGGRRRECGSEIMPYNQGARREKEGGANTTADEHVYRPKPLNALRGRIQALPWFKTRAGPRHHSENPRPAEINSLVVHVAFFFR